MEGDATRWMERTRNALGTDGCPSLYARAAVSPTRKKSDEIRHVPIFKLSNFAASRCASVTRADICVADAGRGRAAGTSGPSKLDVPQVAHVQCCPRDQTLRCRTSTERPPPKHTCETRAGASRAPSSMGSPPPAWAGGRRGTPTTTTAMGRTRCGGRSVPVQVWETGATDVVDAVGRSPLTRGGRERQLQAEDGSDGRGGSGGRTAGRWSDGRSVGSGGRGVWRSGGRAACRSAVRAISRNRSGEGMDILSASAGCVSARA